MKSNIKIRLIPRMKRISQPSIITRIKNLRLYRNKAINFNNDLKIKEEKKN